MANSHHNRVGFVHHHPAGGINRHPIHVHTPPHNHPTPTCSARPGTPLVGRSLLDMRTAAVMTPSDHSWPVLSKLPYSLRRGGRYRGRGGAVTEWSGMRCSVGCRQGWWQQVSAPVRSCVLLQTRTAPALARCDKSTQAWCAQPPSLPHPPPHPFPFTPALSHCIGKYVPHAPVHSEHPARNAPSVLTCSAPSPWERCATCAPCPLPPPGPGPEGRAATYAAHTSCRMQRGPAARHRCGSVMAVRGR